MKRTFNLLAYLLGLGALCIQGPVYAFNLSTGSDVIVTPAPSTYGIFIGYDQGLIRSGADAVSFRDQLVSVGVLAAANTRILGATDIPTINQTIQSFGLKSGDQLYFYFSGHGGPAPSGGEVIQGRVHNTNDEMIQLKPNYFLTDDSLYQGLSGLSGVEKWVFLDACYSGGFWGNELENGGDLERLSDIAFIAAAPEFLPTVSFIGVDLDPLWYLGGDYGNPTDFGRGLLTLALEDAYTYRRNGFLRADYNKDRKVDPSEIKAWLQSYDTNSWAMYYVAEKGLGDISIFDETLWNPEVMYSDNFPSRSTYAAGIPEPGTFALLGLGLAGLGAMRRKKLAA